MSYPIKVVVLGEGAVGKSAVTMSLIRSRFVTEYDPTIEDSYSTSRTIQGVEYRLDILDTAGQYEYRGLFAAQHLTSADAFLLVYDITSPDSLLALEEFNDMICASSEAEAEARGGQSVHPVRIVVGNKCDLASDRKIASGDGLSWARGKGCYFMETSAKLRVNIEETFALLVRRVVEQRQAQGDLIKEPGNASSMAHKEHQSLPKIPYIESKRRKFLCFC